MTNKPQAEASSQECLEKRAKLAAEIVCRFFEQRLQRKIIKNSYSAKLGRALVVCDFGGGQELVFSCNGKESMLAVVSTEDKSPIGGQFRFSVNDNIVTMYQAFRAQQ